MCGTESGLCSVGWGVVRGVVQGVVQGVVRGVGWNTTILQLAGDYLMQTELNTVQWRWLKSSP